jgi:hypothetical protein
MKQKVSALYHQLNLKKYEQATGRPRSLSLIETLTLALYKQTQHIATKRAIWRDFQPLCSYKTLVVSLNRWALLALALLMKLLKMNQSNAHLVKHTDSTDIPVCLNKNAKRHKTMEGFASWGKGGKGFYYGIKLHLTTDVNKSLLAVAFSPATTDDRAPFLKMNKNMDGLFVADAGYISQALADSFNEEGRRYLFVKPRKNMKKLITSWQYHLYNTRVQVEVSIRSLKLFYGLITSLPRSISGYLGNYVYSLLAYVLA